MTKAPAEMMREYVKSQNFTSTEDIMREKRKNVE